MRLRTLILMAMLLPLAACGKLEFTENPLQGLLPPKILKPSSQGLEIVAGATVGKLTGANNYLVDVAVGPLADKLQAQTPNGYKVFHGVKGAIVSDEVLQ